jgi:predicted metal-dependent phosphoesterase TrpH
LRLTNRRTAAREEHREPVGDPGDLAGGFGQREAAEERVLAGAPGRRAKVPTRRAPDDTVRRKAAVIERSTQGGLSMASHQGNVTANVVTGLGGILALPRGARFFRADLHIHSYGGSYDADASMTPAQIVETALKHGLGLVAVTDHNEITNVAAAVSAAKGTGLLVVPGVELSTPQGHLLAYLPTVQALEKFHGRLDIVDRGTPTSRCKNTIVDCLNLLQSLAGFGILAHVDSQGGFELENPGASPHKLDVLCHATLLGIELKKAASPVTYAEGDEDAGRAQAGKARIDRLGLGEKQYLARVLFSDSHMLQTLGHNAAGAKKVTRVKMDAPSFDAVRIALEDSDARVRIEDLVPPAVPTLLGARFTGGFLDGQAIHLSPNLNCIIGGRGTGKSTMFEALGCLSGTLSDSSLIDSEVWPGELSLYWRDVAGVEHSLQKLTGEPLANLDNPEFGPVRFALDRYGQGETTRLGQRAKSDPLALLHFLDGFMDVVALTEARAAEVAARDALLELQKKIEEAEQKVALIPNYERDLRTTQQQIKASEKAHAKEIVQLQRKLATEREIRARVSEKWQEASSLIDGARLKEKLDEIGTMATPADLSVGGDELKSIVAGANALGEQISVLNGTLAQHASAFEALLKEGLRAWKLKDEAARREIEVKRQELESAGVRLDMAFIQKLAADEARYAKAVEALKTWKPHLKTLKEERARVLKERWSARERVATIRVAYAKLASRILRESLSDLEVSLKFITNASAPEAADQIQEAMGWRTNQVPRARLLTEVLTLPKLLEAIETKKASSLTALSFEDGTHPFTSQDAAEVLERLGEPKTRYALERCEVHDKPRLVVTKKVVRDGKEVYVTREFSKLSLGQQQSILLTLLLSSDGNDPLIIDQPEDNLDGEFIYSSFVPVLRRAKERRQIVIVTHNANIAVLGDAEQIVVLKALGDSGIVTSRGSIDDPATRKEACSILEGAKAAFQRRARIYGIAG